VRPATPGPAGYSIPEQPQAAPAGVLVLDRELVEMKLAETAAVSALLADLFMDEEEEPAAAPVAVVPDVRLVEGLDGPHSQLACRLADRPLWTRAELEQLCAELHLMVDGALDTVNEAALDASGEPLVEDGDDDDYRLNEYARGELLV
jgi:hypothetical protein